MSTQYKEEVDVIVVGTGAAGCAAALGALIHGANKVLVLEKSKRLVGGTTRIAGGGWLWCPNNRFLKELGVKQKPEEIVELLKDLAYPDGKVDSGDAELMRAFAEEWPGVIELLQEQELMNLQVVEVRDEEDTMRVEGLIRKKWATSSNFEPSTGINEGNIKDLAKLMPSYCAENPHDLCPSGKVLAPSGGTTSRQLEKAVKKFAPKSEIRMGTQVVDILFNSSERKVEGCKVVDVKTKEISYIRARQGVVFASGGFSRNQEMVERYLGDGVFGSCAAPTNAGDFAMICESHGIPLSGMDRAWLKQVVLPYKFPERIGVFFLNGDSFFVVDSSGKRFACEKNFYQQRGIQMFQNPKRRFVFYIFDQRSREKYEGPIKSLGSPIPSKDDGEDCLIRGSTVEELGKGIREKLAIIDPAFKILPEFEASLAAQLERFNGFAQNGRDAEFGRGDNTAEYCWHTPRASDNQYPNKTMYPLDKKNLCALIMGLGTLDTKGGPRINRCGQVLDHEGKPISGLYGAGNCVRSATNHSYPASGVTLSNAILFGFLSGRHAMGPAHSNI